MLRRWLVSEEEASVTVYHLVTQHRQGGGLAPRPRGHEPGGMDFLQFVLAPTGAYRVIMELVGYGGPNMCLVCGVFPVGGVARCCIYTVVSFFLAPSRAYRGSLPWLHAVCGVM